MGLYMFVSSILLSRNILNWAIQVHSFRDAALMVLTLTQAGPGVHSGEQKKKVNDQWSWKIQHIQLNLFMVINSHLLNSNPISINIIDITTFCYNLIMTMFIDAVKCVCVLYT